MRRKKEGCRLFGSVRVRCGGCVLSRPVGGDKGPKEMGLSGWRVVG